MGNCVSRQAPLRAAASARPAKPVRARLFAIRSPRLAPPAANEAPFHPPGAPLPWAFRAATARMVRSALEKSRRVPHLLAKAVTKL